MNIKQAKKQASKKRMMAGWTGGDGEKNGERKKWNTRIPNRYIIDII